MNAIILMLFAADPMMDLQAAFESAKTADLSYDWSGFKVTLVNPETIKKLSPLVEVKGEPRNFPSTSGVGTHEIIWVTLHGKTETKFYVGKSFLVYDETLFQPADNKLWVALRAYFVPPPEDPPKGKRITTPPVIEDDVPKTIGAAMKACDKLEIIYREVKMNMDLNDTGKEMYLDFLTQTGKVIHNAKTPANPVEVVFVNKETRIPIYLVGDTAYWGEGKQCKSVRLTRDLMWKQMVRMVPQPEPAESAFPAKPK
ncbi:MAG: hypothetical protein ACR2FY_17120 [Pirellulaceae bacterium]